MEGAVHDRSGVLRVIAAATKKKRGHEAPEHDEGIIRTQSEQATIDRFLAEANAIGMQAELTSEDDLPELIMSLRKGEASGMGVLEPALAESRPHLRDLPDCLIEPTEDELFEASVGIVSATGGIAETGSILRMAGPKHPRGFALVPMTIIVVINASDIVDDLYDWLGKQDAGEMPSEVVLITGPSKTADIGMKLVTGIHGPGYVHIAVVGDA